MVERITEAAKAAIEALKASPALLVLTLLIGALLYVSIDRQRSVNQITSELHELLSRCIAPK